MATRVEFGGDYPASEPLAFETAHQFAWDQDRHIIPATGRCCLWLDPLSKWDPNDPDGLHAFLDQLALFFERQFIFEAKGSWPGPSWDHGVFGYWDFIVEQIGGVEAANRFLSGLSLARNDKCPCGSERRYKRCHLPKFETLARRVGPFWLQRVVEWRSKNQQASPCGAATPGP